MSPASQLIWRNLHRIQRRLSRDQSLLLVAPAADGLAAQLAREGFQPRGACLSWAAHERLQADGIETVFGLAAAGGGHSLVILFQPREKALLDMLLAFCGALLEPSGELWLVGENRSGIKSAGKRLGTGFERHAKLDSARHCALFAAHGPKNDRSFSLDDHAENWTFEVGGLQLTVCSLPGVFAHGRLDDGTRLLLDTLLAPDAVALPAVLRGRILDFACGSGAIGLALAASVPAAQLTLVDDSALALECARRSFAGSGYSCKLLASDGLSTLLDSGEPAFDWIVSNPPFHAGVRQDTDTARQFLAGCPRLLGPKGQLCLVANRHLPYGRWLPELFSRVQVLSANPEYNIWLASGVLPRIAQAPGSARTRKRTP